MAYASVTYTSASGTTFALTNSSGDPIPYLRQADIAVTVNGTLKTQGTDYTFNSAGTAIVLSVAVSGATVVISRTTDIGDATVVYTAGSTLTAQDLNNADNQIRYGLQEFSDTYNAITTGTGDLSTLGGFIGSAEVWVADNAHAATTGAIDGRIDTKIDTALTTDVVAGDSITVTDNSPGSGQITIGVTNASISTAKLVDSSVTTAKIADGNVTTAKILDSNVTTAKIADSNVTTAKIADSAITSAKIADGTIVASDLASDAVTTAKILDANVTTGKIADGAVTTGKLADSSVTSGKIADGTIVASDLASDSVTTAKILDANVTTAKIADSNVTTGKIADSAVTAVKIADGVITSTKLNASTVVTNAEQSASTPDDTSFFTTSASDARYVNVTGDTMSGALAMGNNKITGLATPTVSTDASTKGYVDATVAAGTIADADYGDITVTGTGTIWTIDSGVVTSAKIADGTIVNADINASAAIAGTKISPDFGSQTIATTGVFSHALGAAATPSVTFTGDPNTGIYSPGADQVAISTNGVQRLTVDTAATTSTLPVVHPLGAVGTPSITFTGDTNTGIYSPGADQFAITTGGSGRVFVDSSGRVGLGTSSPGATFEAYTSSARRVRIGETPGYTASDYSALGGSVTFSRASDNRTDLHAIYAYDNAGPTKNNLAITSRNDTVFINDNAERLRITDTGRVGIGTTSPGALLTLAASVPELRLVDSDNSLYGTITAPGGDIYIDADKGNGAGGSIIRFAVDDSEKARLDSSGRLLVGTSSARSNFFNGTFTPSPVQIEGSTFATSLLSITCTQNGTEEPGLLLSKARGTNGLVSSGDLLGSIIFSGADGTELVEAASIKAAVDGTPGANDMPCRLVFSTTADGASSPTERMRINSAGQPLFGCTSSTTVGSHTGASNVSTFNFSGITLTQYAVSAGFYYDRLNFTNAQYFVVNSSGTGVYLGNGSTSWTAYSDERLKTNIVELDGAAAWEHCKAARAVTFNWKPENYPDGQKIGFIAQDWEALYPEVITTTNENIDGVETPKGMQYTETIPVLMAALKEAIAKIETLEAKVAALEAS